MKKHRDTETVNEKMRTVGIELDRVISLSIAFKVVLTPLDHMQCLQDLISPSTIPPQGLHLLVSLV